MVEDRHGKSNVGGSSLLGDMLSVDQFVMHFIEFIFVSLRSQILIDVCPHVNFNYKCKYGSV